MFKSLNFYSLLIGVGLFFQSCDPPRNCNEPKCIYSDVNTEIEVNLSGNLDSVINVGDTIRLYMQIPQKMTTNYGDIEFGSLLINSFFSSISGGGDTLIGESEGAFLGFKSLDPISIRYSSLPTGRHTWNYPTREYECLFIPKEKGKYIIDFVEGRIEIKATNGKEWLVNPNFVWDAGTTKSVRINQYLSWMAPHMRPEAYSIISERKCWYCFEVR